MCKVYGNSCDGTDGADPNEVEGAPSFPYAMSAVQSTIPFTAAFIDKLLTKPPFNVLTMSALAPSNPTSI